MAAHIDGATVHHWSGIPVAETDGGATRDNSKLSARCQCLRFILIDEISMIGAQLFGLLELVIRKVIRKKSVYKIRPNGTERPFGGVNILLFGDWWQIKPVSGAALFTDPTIAQTETTRHGLNLLWGEKPNAIRKCWELCTPMRCDDIWFNDFLNQCRNGELNETTHQFIHGYPTMMPTSIGEFDIWLLPCADPIGNTEPRLESNAVPIPTLQSH